MVRAVIKGTGFYVPENKVENSYFNKRYGMDIDSFLREKRNIFCRYYMSPSQATSDLIVPALERAINHANIGKEDIDLLIVATDTPDYLSPSTASVVQYKMGLKNAGTFDLNAACAGFVSALDVASKYILADDRYRNIAVVGAYGMSKFINWDDYKIASLFADGAGAVILQRGEKQGILASQLYTDGQYHDYMGIYGGGTYKPIDQDALNRKDNLLNFAKKIPLETNSIHWPRLIRSVLDKSNRKLSDVKSFFMTQINIGTINETLRILDLPESMSHNVMDRFGYTGSACIPMALADAVLQKKLKKDDLIMLVGSGGGVAMATMAIEWGIDS